MTAGPGRVPALIVNKRMLVPGNELGDVDAYGPVAAKLHGHL